LLPLSLRLNPRPPRRFIIKRRGNLPSEHDKDNDGRLYVRSYSPSWCDAKYSRDRLIRGLRSGDADASLSACIRDLFDQCPIAHMPSSKLPMRPVGLAGCLNLAR
jgi:hypothetical protein